MEDKCKSVGSKNCVPFPALRPSSPFGIGLPTVRFGFLFFFVFLLTFPSP